MATFQSRLREAMDEKGISQAELARRTGITRTSISKYLKGTFKAKQQYLSALAKVLNVDEAWLMGLDVDKKRSYRPGDDPLPNQTVVRDRQTVDQVNYKDRQTVDQSVDEAVDKMLEEMRSYRGLEISNAQRESIKTILKAYVKEKQDK